MYIISFRKGKKGPLQYLTSFSLTPEAFDYSGSTEESDALRLCSAHVNPVYELLKESLSRDRTFRSYTVAFSFVGKEDSNQNE